MVVMNTIGYTESLPPFPQPMVLDEVEFQISAKHWVSTQTALLTVNVNATLTDADLVKARDDMMKKLNQIAVGEWHLTQFDRSQDSSGLEKLYVQAQARVNQANLTHIYQNAKSVTKPGATYELGSVEFKPSLEEIQQVKSLLRKQLYELANEELARLNKIYQGQNYTLNQLEIMESEYPGSSTRSYRAKGAMAMLSGSSAAPSLSVSNELVMTASVKAASTRKPVN